MKLKLNQQQIDYIDKECFVNDNNSYTYFNCDDLPFRIWKGVLKLRSPKQSDEKIYKDITFYLTIKSVARQMKIDTEKVKKHFVKNGCNCINCVSDRINRETAFNNPDSLFNIFFGSSGTA